MSRKYKLKDIKCSSNYRSMRIKCPSAFTRLRLLKILMDVGIKWHGETHWTPQTVEDTFPWADYNVVEFDLDNMYMQGNRSSVYLQTIPFRSFLEAMNDD